MGTRRLEGKRVLLTGPRAGSRAMATAFAQEGARVAITYTRDEEGAAGVLERLRAAGLDDARAYKVSVLDGVKHRVDGRELEQAWGGLDVLVNNAGSARTCPWP